MNALFDNHTQKVMQLATVEAQRLNSEMIGTGHILLGLMADSGGIFDDGLVKFDCDIDSVRREVGNLVESANHQVVGKVPMNLLAKMAIEHALILRENEPVSRIHLLIGILQYGDAVAVQVLDHFGVSSVDVMNDALNAIAT